MADIKQIVKIKKIEEEEYKIMADKVKQTFLEEKR